MDIRDSSFLFVYNLSEVVYFKKNSINGLSILTKVNEWFLYDRYYCMTVIHYFVLNWFPGGRDPLDLLLG